MGTIYLQEAAACSVIGGTDYVQSLQAVSSEGDNIVTHRWHMVHPHAHCLCFVYCKPLQGSRDRPKRHTVGFLAHPPSCTQTDTVAPSTRMRGFLLFFCAWNSKWCAGAAWSNCKAINRVEPNNGGRYAIQHRGKALRVQRLAVQVLIPFLMSGPS